MCYSAQIEADYRRFVRTFGARIDLQEFMRLYWEREQSGRKIVIPKAVDAMFSEPQTDDERRIREMIERFNKVQAAKIEEELFEQRTRLADAERALQSKTTKAAAESKRIAGNKIEAAFRRLDDLRRTELIERDARIFPGHYAPVMVLERGERVVKPMRYQCRPAGKPPFYDTKYPGLYNARRDNLEGFWKQLFGYSHGLMVANAFYENVNKAQLEGRELKAGEKDENVVLEFRPRPATDMLVACLWSRWQEKDEPQLLSFAAITDEPPPEIAAVGHNRCIIPIRPGNVDSWLAPNASNLAVLYAILDDRERPYYEHRFAA